MTGITSIGGIYDPIPFAKKISPSDRTVKSQNDGHSLFKLFRKRNASSDAVAPQGDDVVRQKYRFNGKLKGISARHIEFIKRVLMVKQFADILMTPVYVYNIVNICLKFRRQTVDKRIDSALNIATDFKDVGESTGAFVGGLEKVAKVPSAHVAWLGPFAICMSIFSLAGIVKNIRTCFKMKSLIHEINLAANRGKINNELTMDSYCNVMDLFDERAGKDEDFASDYFNADDIKFTEALLKIEDEAGIKLNSKDEAIKQDGQQQFDKALRTLKGRLRKEILHGAVAATASVVALIATAILFCSPASPIGWVILGAAAGMDLLRYAHHKYVEYKFAKSIHLERTKFEWLVC